MEVVEGGWLDYASLMPTQPSWGWGLADLGKKHHEQDWVAFMSHPY